LEEEDGLSGKGSAKEKRKTMTVKARVRETID
jgi:hypothetical protein